MAINRTTVCLMAIVAALMLSGANAAPKKAPAANNGSPFDSLWICVFNGTGFPECGRNEARAKFNTLAKTYIAAANVLNWASAVQTAVVDGCCIQIDFSDSEGQNLPAHLKYVTNVSPKAVQNWAKNNKACGPDATVAIYSGWDVQKPGAAAVFGCNTVNGAKAINICACKPGAL